MMLLHTGESGLVYKAYLDTAVGTQIVAIKTVKGVQSVWRSILSMSTTHIIVSMYIFFTALFYCFHWLCCRTAMFVFQHRIIIGVTMVVCTGVKKVGVNVLVESIFDTVDYIKKLCNLCTLPTLNVHFVSIKAYLRLISTSTSYQYNSISLHAKHQWSLWGVSFNMLGKATAI